MIYATQEVSLIHKLILSNTANWIVQHLNSRNETSALTKYYDFEMFEEAILKTETHGFAKIRTRSGPYTLPVQIDRFSSQHVQAAREALGNGSSL